MRHFSMGSPFLYPINTLSDCLSNHFASDLSWLLLGKRPPDWVNATADGMARNGSKSDAKQSAQSEALATYTPVGY